MDQEGYPEQSELNEIINWKYEDAFSLIEYLKDLWTYKFLIREEWIKNEEDDYIFKLYVSTGGWSGNEDLIGALLDNTIFRSVFYKQWNRGGHYVFEIDPEVLGYKKVSDYCKENKISRQAVHKSKQKYEWINASNKIRFIRKF